MTDEAVEWQASGRIGLGVPILTAALGVLLGCGVSRAPAADDTRAPQAAMHDDHANRPTTGTTPETQATERAAPDLPQKNAEPPYDLSADIEERTNTAKVDLGSRVEVLVVEDVFVVAARGGKGTLAGAIDVTKKALAAYFNGRFTTRPSRAISVYLFADAEPYNAYCKARTGEPCNTPYGFYRYDERRIVMNVGPGIGTLTHELVHPLVEADFPNAPDWINEGIASLFEQFYFPRVGEIRGGKNWRHPRLLRALRSKSEREHARLPTLFSMNDAVFRGEREDLNYAMARYFCQWLDQQKLLWPFYQRWRDGFRDDPSGEKAFLAVVGKTPEEADAEWTRWVRRL